MGATCIIDLKKAIGSIAHLLLFDALKTSVCEEERISEKVEVRIISFNLLENFASSKI